ncbi:hypothetical protein DFH08DRAFT_689790 [Mycena albidolilacea]|uniref:F-box domain-containing protein n=1 Tax=Mycena albidolilacea TaxID=1033008 RepID=A0AAD7ADP6_9AGAR|nr:hypothetical protein DFH08DRAFT_689790 [Mycena albidolilacea]
METRLAISYIDEPESQIALLDETTTSLQFRRTDLLKSVKTHKAILAPVRRLPSEILGEIFLFVLSATFRLSTVAKPPMTQHAPWLFTRICRHWSAVALTTPALWSIFLLDLDQDFVDPNRAVHTGAVSLTKLCLERSGRNVPLNVHILQGET